MPRNPDRPSYSPRADNPAGDAPHQRPKSGADNASASNQEAAVPQATKRSVSRAAWFALIAGAVALIFLLVFVLQNNVPTELTFWAWTFTSPVGVAMLFAAIAGALVTALVGTARMIVLGRTVRTLEHERDKNH